MTDRDHDGADMQKFTLEKLEESLGFPVNGWTNGVVINEAITRGLKVTRDNRRNLYFIANDRGHWFSWRHGYTNWNTRLAQRVAQHKDVSSRILSAYGVPSTENQVFTEQDAGRA